MIDWEVTVGGDDFVVSIERGENGKDFIRVNGRLAAAPMDAADLERGFAMFRNAIHTHIITSHCAAQLLIETAKNSGRTGLIVEIGDGDTYSYRGHLFFDLIKTTVIRLAFAVAYELRKKNVAAVALTPGFLRSEVMLERFGVSEATHGNRPQEQERVAVEDLNGGDPRADAGRRPFKPQTVLLPRRTPVGSKMNLA